MLLWEGQEWHSIDKVGASSANVKLLLVLDVSEYGNMTVAQCLHSIATCEYLCIKQLVEELNLIAL